LLAAAGGEERVMLTEVSRTREGQAQALYNFDGRGMNELPLRKVITKKSQQTQFEKKLFSAKFRRTKS